MGTGGSAAPVAARIAGDVRGQVAVGNNIVQYNVDHGGVVWAADPAGIPRPRLRERVEIRGRRPRLVGREAELRAVSEVLAPETPVELSGPAGIGKTTLLKHLAHDLPAPTVAVVYHDARGEPAEDVLQFLYDAFYDAGVPFKPTPGQLRDALADVVGLIVLDEVALDRVDVESVLGASPGATFVLASEEQRLWGMGRSLPVRGLPARASVALLERELGRAVVGEERASAEEACRALGGHPLRVVQLAALVRDLGGAATDASASLTTAAGDGLVDRLRSSLGAEQLRVLAILEAAMGASLSARHLAELVGVPDIQAAVEPLLRVGLVQAHSPRYSVREPRRRLRSDSGSPNPVADYLAALGEADHEPDRLAEEAAAILQAVGRARELGDWTTVLRLGRAAERALTMSRRWGAWEIVLRHQLEAARALGDGGAEAWALHQLGTRALCLDDPSGARANLGRALAIREALGDEDGSAASRHNLEHLDGPPPPPPGRSDAPMPPDPPPPGPPSRRGLMTAIAAAAAVVLVAAIAVLVGCPGDGTDSRALRIQGTDYSVTIEPADVDFGEVPVGSTTSPRRLTIVNTGSSSLHVRPVAGIDAAAGFVVVNDACAATDLPAAGRCDVEVVFRPTTAGTRKANVAVPLPDRTQSVTFTGRGVDRAVPVPDPPPDTGPTTLPTVAPTTRPPLATTTTTTIPVEVDLAVEMTETIRSCSQVAGLVCDSEVVVKVTNNGTATATNVRLTVDGQGGLSVTPDCPGTPSCRWSSLAAGQFVDARIGVEYAKTPARPSIKATVGAAERDLDPTNNTRTYP